MHDLRETGTGPARESLVDDRGRAPGRPSEDDFHEAPWSW